MFNTHTSDASILTQKADCYIFLLEEGFEFNASLQEVAQTVFPQLPELFKQEVFTGKLMSMVAVPAMINNNIAHCLFVGLGKPGPQGLDIENFRRAVAVAVRKSTALRGARLAIHMPSIGLFKCTSSYLLKQAVIILNMAAFEFTHFWTDQERVGVKVADVVLCNVNESQQIAEQALKDGQIIANAVNNTRHLIDMPPSSMTPDHFAERAQEIAQKNSDLSLTVFNEPEIIKMGMGGLAGVSRGSDLDCKLIIIEYKTKVKDAPTIAFVGKGITFDSGGLSLKPADSMENMKDDMSGAAAVINTMEALAQLHPDVNVIGIAPVSENLPSGGALKPGDVVRFYNGKTAEIKNTDAEGRLVLADALSYAVKHYKLDAIMDVATLTGACAYFLGPYFTGMMSRHDAFVAQVQQAADVTGDRVWRLPLHEDYKVAIRTPMADLSNTGSSRIKSGAITAAWFLNNFVDDVPWVHLDIAGTAYDVPEIPYFRAGATGASVRLMIELAMSWKK